jgi:hypothetical protein
MQVEPKPKSFPVVPVVWTPDGCVVVGGPAAPIVPAFAERKRARIFTGPFFFCKDRSSPNALQAWNEITNSMAPQTGVTEQSLSSSLISSSSSLPFSSSRAKFSRENITAHMHKFHERALRIAEQSSRDAVHVTALDGALGLTEAFFACKGDEGQHRNSTVTLSALFFFICMIVCDVFALALTTSQMR